MILTKKIESSLSIDVTMEDGMVPEKLLTCTSVLPVANKTEKESIHSGQFMVSQFEAEETMDDLVDSEVKMLDPEDPNLLKLDEVSTCLEVQLYIPRKLGQINELENSLTTRLITSQIEIETSLTKLFKCMNLAYSQKLTSPKWNHFKGVRLRWKDKIRLNNVIWRCWHMQFILKRRTPVVQFASPLDVDVHSNPQSVVLEGKYWKRQLTVIKAEYRKWRRNYKSKSIGCLTLDTKSEFDFLEWSSLNEKNCILSDDWTSDALFSAINVPFPFPDPREIARGAGIADFIQPSLGPLQPNLDDIDITFADLVHDSRLPSVPEEGSDEVLKNYEYGFSAIMEHDQFDSSVVMDEATTNIVQMENNNGTHMAELNTPRNTLQFIEQQFITREEDTKYKTNPNSIVVSNDVIADQHNNSSSLNYINRKKFLTNDISSNKSNEIELTGKGIKKGRISKNFHRFFRREPHNYDKAQPTAHQTTIYQQMLSEQNMEQSSQHHILSHHDTCMEQPEMLTFREHLHLQTPKYTNSLLINSNSLHISNPKDMDIKTSNEHISSLTPSNQSSQLLLNVKIEPSSSDVFSMFNIKPCKSFVDESQAFKKSASAGPYFKKGPCDRNQVYLHDEIRMREHDNVQSLPLNLNSAYPTLQSTFKPTCSHQEHQPLSPKQDFIPKEIFRSNSLPLNVSQHHTHNNNFTTPQYHAKSTKSHSLSNSVNQYVTSTANNLSNMFQLSQRMQPVTNDPILTNTMDRLLTASERISLSKEKFSTNVLRNLYEPINPVSSNYHMQVKGSNLVNHMKSISMPEPAVSESFRSSRSAKMLSYPPSITCSTKLKVSTEIFTGEDGPLSSISYVPRDNQRRTGHIQSEQKRRYNIKNGFDMLHSLIPHLQENCKIAKLSKAAMLQKGADHIKQLRTERNFLQEKINELINERDCLNTSLTHLHTILPANGAPLLRQRSNHVLLLFEKYIRFRTSRNWKFWLLGFILEPLLTSYSSSVSNANMEEMCRTAFLWIDQHCSLIDLRPVVSNKLKYLSMKTDILSDSPSTLHEEIMKALNNTSGQHPNLHGP